MDLLVPSCAMIHIFYFLIFIYMSKFSEIYCYKKDIFVNAGISHTDLYWEIKRSLMELLLLPESILHRLLDVLHIHFNIVIFTLQQ